MDLILFLAGVAFTKGVLEPLLAKWTRRGVVKYVPRILNRLDSVLPRWIESYTEDELRAKVETLIYEETKPYETLTPGKAQQILEEVVNQYSFLVNANNYGPFG